MFFSQEVIDVFDLEKLFYDIVKGKTPSEMNYEDFIDGLRLLSRKLAKLCANNNENVNALMANDDLLFNRFLLKIVKPYCEE